MQFGLFDPPAHGAPGYAPAPGDAGYTLVSDKTSLGALQALLEALPDATVVALDVETTGFYWMADRVVGFSLSWEEGLATYVPVSHADQGARGFGPAEVTGLVRLLKRHRVVCHKAVFDTSFMWANFGVALPIWDDTLLLARLLELPLSLDDLMAAEFGRAKPVKFTDVMVRLFGRHWKSAGKTAADSHASDFSLYCCRDSDYCRRAYFRLKPRLRDRNLQSLHKVEVNILEAVRRMNCRGAPVNAELSSSLAVLMRDQARVTGAQVREAVRRPDLNLNSYPQVADVLYLPPPEGLGLPCRHRTDSGAPSSGDEALEEMEPLHPVVPLIRQYRQETELAGALAEIPAMAAQTGRVHSQFNSLGARSGRFTSGGVDTPAGHRGMQLQNVANNGVDLEADGFVLPEVRDALLSDMPAGEVPGFSAALAAGHRVSVVPTTGLVPVRLHYDVKVREMFVAPPGMTWVKVDLSQIEYRLLASLSGEPSLLDGFRAGYDYHRMTAAFFLDLLLEEVTKAQRSVGKTLNFALAFGAAAPKVAAILGCSEEEAVRKLETYRSRIPRVVAYEAAVRRRASVEGFSRTFFGRVRSFPDLSKMSSAGASHQLRAAWNHVIQGTAADILKIAMLRVLSRMRRFGKAAEMVLTVHDEFDFVVANEAVPEFLPEVRAAMEVPVPPTWAPILAEVSSGPCWAERHLKAYKPAPDAPHDVWTGNWADVVPPEVADHDEV